MMKNLFLAAVFLLEFSLPTKFIWAETGFNISHPETFIYEITDKDSIKYNSKITYQKDIIKGEKIFSYYYNDPKESWNVKTDKDANPLQIEFNQGKNSINFNFKESDAIIVNGIWDGKAVSKEVYFDAQVTMENALKLRTLDLSTDKKQRFNLIQQDKLPDIEPYEMYFKVMGEKSISVKAGKFVCKKVLFSLNDWRGMFYKAYYYVSDDEHRYLVKMENIPRGGRSELIRIE